MHVCVVNRCFRSLQMSGEVGEPMEHHDKSKQVESHAHDEHGEGGVDVRMVDVDASMQHPVDPNHNHHVHLQQQTPQPQPQQPQPQQPHAHQQVVNQCFLFSVS